MLDLVVDARGRLQPQIQGTVGTAGQFQGGDGGHRIAFAHDDVEVVRDGGVGITDSDLHPMGGGALLGGGSPREQAIGGDRETGGPGHEPVGEGLGGEIGVGGLEVHRKELPLEDLLGAGRGPDRGLIQFLHDDVEFLGGSLESVVHHHAHPVGAGALRFGGPPGEQSVGGDRESGRAAEELVGQALGRQIGVGRLELEGQEGAFGHPSVLGR